MIQISLIGIEKNCQTLFDNVMKQNAETGIKSGRSETCLLLA